MNQNAAPLRDAELSPTEQESLSSGLVKGAVLRIDSAEVDGDSQSTWIGSFKPVPVSLAGESPNSELAQREAVLNGQIAQLEIERRQFRAASEQASSEFQRREQAVAEREAQLVQDQARIQLRQNELIARESQLAADQATLAYEREQFLADSDRIRHEVKHEQSLIESRYRFQQDHLERSMRDLEIAQREFRKEQQETRARLSDTATQNILRNQQLVRFRARIVARQESAAREEHWQLVERRAIESRLREEREDLRLAKQRWEQSSSEQKSELARQQQQLTEFAEQLEARRAHLDSVEWQVSCSHRDLLELRVILEEATNQLLASAGEEIAEARVAEARELLVESYRHNRETLQSRKQELEQLRVELDQQRQELVEDRRRLTDWVAQCESNLSSREDETNNMRAALDSRELEWRGAESRWNEQRREAEQIIRSLLDQLDGVK